MALACYRRAAADLIARGLAGAKVDRGVKLGILFEGRGLRVMVDVAMHGLFASSGLSFRSWLDDCN